MPQQQLSRGPFSRPSVDTFLRSRNSSNRTVLTMVGIVFLTTGSCFYCRFSGGKIKKLFSTGFCSIVTIFSLPCDGNPRCAVLRAGSPPPFPHHVKAFPESQKPRVTSGLSKKHAHAPTFLSRKITPIPLEDFYLRHYYCFRRRYCPHFCGIYYFLRPPSARFSEGRTLW